MCVEAAKYCEDISVKVTLNRIMDMTYRLNAGSMKYVGNKVSGVVDPSAWVGNFIQCILCCTIDVQIVLTPCLMH